MLEFEKRRSAKLITRCLNTFWLIPKRLTYLFRDASTTAIGHERS
jgi:hypothetical protein